VSVQLSAASPPDTRASDHPVRMLIPLFMGPLIYVYSQSMVFPGLGAVAQSLHTSRLQTTWALTGYLISGAVTTPLAGRLGDLFGNRKVLMWVLWISAAGGVLSAVGTSLLPVAIGRVLAGTVTATMPLGYGIMRESLPRARLAPAVAFVSVSIAIGTGLGNITSGVVIDNLGTHWLFWLPLILIVPTALMAQLWVPDPPGRERGTVHWAGAVAMAVALLCLLIAISETTTWGWGSVRTLGLLALGLVALAVWILVELRADEPLIDMRLMALPGVWWTNLTSFLFGFAMFGTFVVIPQFVETPRSAGYGFGASITAAGLFLIPATVIMSFGGPLSGRLEQRFGPKLPLILGGLIGVAGYLLICFLHSDRWIIYGAFVLLGIGMGVGYSVLPHLIVLAVPLEHTGGATGINVIARNIGGALGVQLSATVIAAHLAHGAVIPTRSGFVITFWLLAAGGIGALVCSACIPTKPHRPLGTPRLV
jgi:MFS family permease